MEDKQTIVRVTLDVRKKLKLAKMLLEMEEPKSQTYGKVIDMAIDSYFESIGINDADEKIKKMK